MEAKGLTTPLRKRSGTTRRVKYLLNFKKAALAIPILILISSLSFQSLDTVELKYLYLSLLPTANSRHVRGLKKEGNLEP